MKTCPDQRQAAIAQMDKGPGAMGAPSMRGVRIVWTCDKHLPS